MNELSWRWVGFCRVSDCCDAWVWAEKFYYVCSECNLTQDKRTLYNVL